MYTEGAMIKQYIAYLKDNPQGLWFKAKLYGWGWTPARWQGWAVIAAYLVVLFALASKVDKARPAFDQVLTFFLPLVAATVALILVCYKTGERPRWRWGLPKEDRKGR